MTTAEDVSFHGETATLVVSQARSPIALGCAENTVLLEQVVNDGLLLSVHPAGEQQAEERKRRQQWIHGRKGARGTARGSSPDRRDSGARKLSRAISILQLSPSAEFSHQTPST